MQRFGSACVLAGGAGRRMAGIDKLTIRLGGERVVDRIVRILRLRFDDILIVTARPQLFPDPELRITADILPGHGPLGGLHAGLTSSRSRWLYLTACDMPWQSGAWIDLLETGIRADESRCEISGEARATAAFAGTGPYLEPFAAFYSRDALPLVEAALRGPAGEGGRLSLQALFRDRRHLEISEPERSHIDPEGRIFGSINTLEELSLAQKIFDAE